MEDLVASIRGILAGQAARFSYNRIHGLIYDCASLNGIETTSKLLLDHVATMLTTTLWPTLMHVSLTAQHLQTLASVCLSLEPMYHRSRPFKQRLEEALRTEVIHRHTILAAFRCKIPNLLSLIVERGCNRTLDEGAWKILIDFLTYKDLASLRVMCLDRKHS